MTSRTTLALSGVAKTFTMHLRGGVRLPVVNDVSFSVAAGQCVVLGGPSGIGKSSILKMVYGNYRCDAGQILVHANDEIIDVAQADPRRILRMRASAVSYVSQFLRAIPRVPAIDIVAEPLLAVSTAPSAARERAGELLTALNVPQRLWELPPATFSGGEQQRINIARGFLVDKPLLLLDEPTASLDAENRAVVANLIAEKKRRGTAVVAIAHDEDVRDAIADDMIDIRSFAAAA
jgi:alpha-D-ribose 1-methylphosphonate 5-triphosphate synthase subunit PhnL